MVKLHGLRILQFGDVVPGTVLRFDSRANLLIGDSGAGKTTLLGLLAAICGTDFSRLEHEPFDLVYEVRDGVFTAVVAITGGGPPQRSPIDGLPEPAGYSYRIGIHRGDTDPVCEIVGTPAAQVVHVSGIAEPRHLPPSSPFTRGFLGPALRQSPASTLFFGAWHLFNWQGSAARFDESLDCFLAMTGRGPALPGVALPRPAETVFSFDPRAALRASTTYSLDRYLPGGAIDRAIVEAHRSPGGETLVDAADGDAEPGSAAQSSLGFLRRAAHVLGFRGAAFRPDITSFRHDRATGKLHYTVRGFHFRFLRDDGTAIGHDHLSYGQKRLLAFFYYTSANEQFVIADEILHGIQPDWIPACKRELGRRQCFLTSLDPRLHAHLGLDSVDRVLARVVRCEAVDGSTRLRWQNIAPNAADELFRRHARATTRQFESPDPAAPDHPD